MGGPAPAQDGPRHEQILQALEPIKALLEEDGELDPQELVVIEKIRTDLMKLLADRQKQADSMVSGGKMDPRAVRRMAQ